jgi:hypothetical protein
VNKCWEEGKINEAGRDRRPCLGAGKAESSLRVAILILHLPWERCCVIVTSDVVGRYVIIPCLLDTGF